MSIWSQLEKAISERVLILDGGMGTMIQLQKLEEADFRGERFADWGMSLKGNNDLLSLTNPDAIKKVHNAFLEAGSDLIETNSFNATTISQADYDMSHLAAEIAEASAIIARECADEWTKKTPEKPRAVLGSIGPTNKTLSISPKVEDPGFRDVTYDEVQIAYAEQVRAMFPHVDAIMIETVFDTLNCKAAISATHQVFEEMGQEKPLLLSGTITDRSGRTLSGQTAEAFWLSVSHAKPFAVGLNCALGASEMRPYISALSKVADCWILAFPNAGLPNAFGEYDETPDDMREELAPWAEEGLINIVGACCGSTPEHIGAIAQGVAGIKPRERVTITPTLRLSGLEPFALNG